jgi:large subunit ribosomal protein L7/L12
MSKVQSIIEEIKGLSLLEASELVKGLETAFGVSAAAPQWRSSAPLRRWRAAAAARRRED